MRPEDSLDFKALSPSLEPQQNQFGQWIGKSVNFHPPTLPPLHHKGVWVSLRPLSEDDHETLFSGYGHDEAYWTYMPIGPFPTRACFTQCLSHLAQNGFHFMAILDHSHPTPQAAGFCAYMRQDSQAGSLEIGSIALGPRLQRSRAATEALYLVINAAFEAGFRRFEWKCDQLNQPSVKAALRLGFRYEGTFRNAMVIKGRRRDTAWFSIILEEWPLTKTCLEDWLDIGNFHADGRQIRALSDIILG